MIHHKNKHTISKLTPLLAGAVMVVSSIVSPVMVVHGISIEEQIRQKEAEQAVAQNQANKLGSEANTVEGQIEKLQNEIASIQAQIDLYEKKQKELNDKIEAAQKRLAEQKDLLSANIRSMYIEGDISPLEILASSKNLSDFVDKQEYRDRIKENITSTLDEIEKLKKELDEQKQAVVRIIEEKKSLRGSRQAKQQEANEKLGAINQSKASFDKEVDKKASEISSLRAQQAALNVRFTGGTPGVGAACGGGYPGSATGAGGTWGCNYGLDQGVDNWGMYNRECVSYTAFKVAQSGRNMPGWGFTGPANANQWPSRASSSQIKSSPRAGDVAISMAGYYGHAMYVEAVYGNGTIKISQYNAGWDGLYSEAVISSSGLVFIRF